MFGIDRSMAHRIGIALAAPLLLPAVALADVTQSVTPVADAFVSSANPSSNYGSAGALAVSAPGLAKGEFQSVLKFDLSSAKTAFDASFGAGNWHVASITLKLTGNAPNNALFNGNGAGPGGSNVNTAGLVAVSWMSNDSWTEGSGTPATPAASGITFAALSSLVSPGDDALGSFSFSGTTSAAEIYTLLPDLGLIGDVTSGSLASLRLAAAGNTASAVFSSRSVPASAQWPVLSITAAANAVPEPATLALAGVAAPLLMGRRRPKKACRRLTPA